MTEGQTRKLSGAARLAGSSALSSKARSTTRAARRREQQRHPPPRQDRKARSARAEIQVAYRWRAANCLGLYRVAISGRVLTYIVK
jgi:hypothetical protein